MELRWAVQVRVRSQWRNVQYFEFEHLQRARAAVDAWRASVNAVGQTARLWDLKLERVYEMADPRPMTSGSVGMAKGESMND